MKSYESVLDDIIDKIDSNHTSISINRNPLNEKEEKKKFFSSTTYNPIFKYKRTKQNNSLLFSKAKKIKVKGEIGKALIQKLKYLEIRQQMFDSIGSNQFFQKSNLVYGKPDKKLISIAKKIIMIKPSQEHETITTKEAIIFTKKILKTLNLKNWKVDEKNIGSKVLFLGMQKRIILKKHCEIKKDFLKRILVHEIGTHAFRTENGKIQPYKIFNSGFARYITTEEGLAVNIEEMHNCLDQNVIRNYAGRVLAIDFASKNSFRKTFYYLSKYFSLEDAWQLCVRVKRGMQDTSKAGAYPRDHIYLKGYFTVKEHLLKNKNGLEKLFVGKIGLEHIKIVSKIKGLKKPIYLPNSNSFKEFVKKY